MRRRIPEQERVVNFYNWSDYIDPAVLDGFTAETGIKVRYDTFDSNDTLEAKLLAGKSGYDVVVPRVISSPAKSPPASFAKLDKSKLPNLVNTWPEIADTAGKLRSRKSIRRELHVGHDGHRIQRATLLHGCLAKCGDRLLERRYSTRRKLAVSRIAASTSSTRRTTSCPRRCIICDSIRTRALRTICSAPLICS